LIYSGQQVFSYISFFYKFQMRIQYWLRQIEHAQFTSFVSLWPNGVICTPSTILKLTGQILSHVFKSWGGHAYL
jgi:hypothetical protein